MVEDNYKQNEGRGSVSRDFAYFRRSRYKVIICKTLFGAFFLYSVARPNLGLVTFFFARESSWQYYASFL